MKFLNGCKAIGFSLVVLCALLYLNYLAQPIWFEWNNYSTVYGFQEEPGETAEALFFGSSRAVTAFSPTELYRDYGICAYNLGTESQPPMAAYYLTREAYEAHRSTLKAVVLECTMMFAEEPSIAMYQKALDALSFPLKLEAVQDYPVDVQKDKKYYLFPLTEYHDRWPSLRQKDFEKSHYDPNLYSRGYLYVARDFLDSTDYTKIAVPPLQTEAEAEAAEFNPKALEYVIRLSDFCREKGIRLVLVTTTNNQTDAKHNALSALAKEQGVEYIDFNDASVFKSMDYNIAVDMYETNHTNYYGASKMTSYIGSYLTEHCGIADVRGLPKYDFMEEELKGYENNVTDVVRLKETSHICDYLGQILSKKYTAFVMVRDSAVNGLSNSDRKSLGEMGLTGLLDLEFREPYLAVIKDGKVIYENPKAGSKKVEKKITYKNHLDNGTSYMLESGGLDSGNIASCKIGGKEYSPNRRGINLVVFDGDHGENGMGSVIDQTCFDTHVSSSREAGYKGELLEEAVAEGKGFNELSDNMKKLFLYNYRCEKVQKVSSLKELKSTQKLASYLDSFWEDDYCMIFLAGKGDPADGFTYSERKTLRKLGLRELAGIRENDSYAAVVYEGNVVHEEHAREGVPVCVELYGVQVESAGGETGNGSGVWIDRVNQSPDQEGINVVVYDTFMGQVLDTATFDLDAEQ